MATRRTARPPSSPSCCRPHLQGDYHLSGPTSPAYGLGAAFTTVAWDSRANGWHYTVGAPSRDIDGDVRPSPAPALRYDAGSDQLP